MLLLSSLYQNFSADTLKKSCIEVGWEYSSESGQLDSTDDVNSIYQCLNHCRETEGCNSVSWDKGNFLNELILFLNPNQFGLRKHVLQIHIIYIFADSIVRKLMKVNEFHNFNFRKFIINLRDICSCFKDVS